MLSLAMPPELLSRLSDSALVVLRRHGLGPDDLRLEPSEPKDPPSLLISGHRVRIQLDARSAAFKVMAGRWSGAREDYPTPGAFLAAFEDALEAAFH